MSEQPERWVIREPGQPLPTATEWNAFVHELAEQASNSSERYLAEIVQLLRRIAVIAEQNERAPDRCFAFGESPRDRCIFIGPHTGRHRFPSEG